MTYTRFDTTFAGADFEPTIVCFVSDSLAKLTDVAFDHCSYWLRETADLAGWVPVPRHGYQQDGVFVTVYQKGA